ncbi:extracellular catalytic domain type 1 short-chain-length polyhydroxyalkanoate depolymerase [Brevibacillus dissolubilis]|uniref:extracellular catalytic domain type 1 short-chain-length polyhydroxyalkanoate depolymerase n=1 Tax=Brevibacillus dissolubilis TaxID=1844116 RepID=UPI0021005FF6|nr:PHB depolymerase family esterase [Brevibacillus dissolubilis]
MNAMKKWLSCLVVLGLMVTLIPYASAAGSFTAKTYNGRTYKLYVPDGYVAGTPIPLVVMLHGCTQDPDQFSAGTQMNALAETEKFLVMYPEQTSSANSNKCWNWFESAHQSRGSGEPALIAGMVDQVKSQYSVDANKVYVGGLSAGAGMSVIMGVTYPDVFAAVAVGAGLEYKAATSMTNAFTAMNSGGPDPINQGNLAYTAMGAYKRVVPVVVFHGTSDYTVYPVNGDQVIAQWAQTNDRASDGADDNNIDATADATINGSVSGGRTYKEYVYKDSASGLVIMKKYIVDGMGHAWSGGSTAGSYTDPQGPNATQLSWQFFQEHPLNGTGGGGGGDTDTTAPVTTASPAGGTYTSAVSVSLTANENATTYYTTNGTTPTTGSTSYTGPISISTNTTLKYFSVDTAGNAEAVKTQTYTISAGSGTGTTFKSIGTEDGFAGQLLADGSSSTVQKAGDKGMYNLDTYRTILSFDTSALPDTATITSAKLRIYRKSLSGSVSNLQVDVKTGYFGTSRSVEQGDFNSTATSAKVATLTVPSANNAYTEVSLSTAALSAINKTGVTQFRLNAVTTTDAVSDVLEIYGGENAGYEPQLILTY